MLTGKGESSQRGGVRTTLLLLLLLGAVSWVAIDFRLKTPGDAIVDRLTAEAVVTDLDLFTGTDDRSLIVDTVYHYLNHHCMPDSSPLGDYVCWSSISSFNGTEARTIAFFFRNDRLSAVRIAFSAENHPAMYEKLVDHFGPAREFRHHGDAYGNNIVGWIRPGGAVSVNDHVEKDQEAILLWLSPAMIKQGMAGSVAASGF